MSVAVVATITPKPEHRDAVRAALVEAIPAVHAEDGCERYALVETPTAFLTVERWTSQAALEAHLAGPIVAQLTAAAGELLAEPFDVTAGALVPAGDAEKGSL